MSIPIIGEIIGLGQTWLQGRNKRIQAKAEAEATIMVKAAEHKADWENIMAKATDNSWKDEAWTIVFIAIVILNFIPGMDPVMDAGFENLGQTPSWFQYAMYGAIAASFGLKTASLFKGLKT